MVDYTQNISTSLRGPGQPDGNSKGQTLLSLAPSRARAVFIDRDGVINQNRPDYVKSWDEFKFLDGSCRALARLASTALRVVVVSNQSAIGRERVTRETVEVIHTRMVQQVEQAGGRVDRVFYCPHRPEESCRCRKPHTGLLEQASRELDVELTCSYLIGDSLEDIEAGHRVGCTTLLVRTGRGIDALAQLDWLNGSRPVVVDDLRAAVAWILQQEHDSLRGREPTRADAPEVSMPTT